MNLKSNFLRVKKASAIVSSLSVEKINDILLDLAEKLLLNSVKILRANRLDLTAYKPSDPIYDRLLLTEDRIKGMAVDIKKIASLPSPRGEITEKRKLINGIKLKKVRVPLGVVGVIYEARPNVTVDVFSLCFKSGNACILKSGGGSQNSARILTTIIQSTLKEHGVNSSAVFLMPSERKYLSELLNARGMVDVIIPRGGKSLIDFVTFNSKVPVIETGAGIVHTYFDESADLKKSARIIFNAKTRRPSVCNSLDTLLIHKNRLKDLAELIKPLGDKNVEILADKPAYQALTGKYPYLKRAKKNDFGLEFLSLKLSIKTVENIRESLEHISKHSSKHSEAILSKNPKNIEYFLNNVDAAVLYVNASTAFTDGGQFGLGAEIGISTQKLHARGPMGLKELTSYKWILEGNGHVRV